MSFFEKATPESCGVSSENIINFVEKLCQVPETLETHSFLLIRTIPHIMLRWLRCQRLISSMPMASLLEALVCCLQRL